MLRGASHALPSVLAAVPRAVVSVGACILALAEAGGEQAAAASDGLLQPLPGPATSAPGLGAPLHKPAQSHLRRDCAHPTPATSAPGLGSPLPHLHQDWTDGVPHLLRDWARPFHICTGTVLAFCRRRASDCTVVFSTFPRCRPCSRPAHCHRSVRAAATCELSACLAMRGAWHPLTPP